MQICKVYKRWFIYFTNIDISINVIKSVWRVRKHETQSNRESCVFHFSHFELYFALHSCVLSTFQQYRSSWGIGRQQQYARDHLFVVPTIWANHFGDVKGKSCY